ncbi:manganese efflux pump [Microbacterium sp. VKM Ac-2870]|uniref:manganese efflux pump MntP n=1 Tax=Microbacterium sp. VKM Ac-2870 TaxID=2783825 RepID=UPI00188DB6C6|nr:manganese efflux pump MntP family protein [Microbacterium sp. VKM Ac-2870]MBF4562417.1 manganese efflux pump [Microbacterium sp. VKM Ac-2870]
MSNPVDSIAFRGAVISPWTLLLLALGVSADAFAVALGKGVQLRAHVLRTALVFATAFGVAQAVMPLLGWLLGSTFAEAIAPWDHWISFGLLALVGGKMLWEALTPDARVDADHPAHVHDIEAFTTREVTLLSIATSIDALAVGVSFAFLDVNVAVAVTTIGLVTFALSFVAVFIGYRIGTRFRRPAEIVGGLVLIGIGTQILIEHLTA